MFFEKIKNFRFLGHPKGHIMANRFPLSIKLLNSLIDLFSINVS